MDMKKLKYQLEEKAYHGYNYYIRMIFFINKANWSSAFFCFILSTRMRFILFFKQTTKINSNALKNKIKSN